ncbi:hypothetical protein L1987_86476 [Smallanthus sonchifolius]|uniref:Uncharacterized protein n=1 Tax=Smallanthus sonchifolius TaxID=185202 RepID=A0ACB8XYU9_9ASTR|nr:hypothetical protein L1987_86476 [Smallanthus sonchifolius]
MDRLKCSQASEKLRSSYAVKAGEDGFPYRARSSKCEEIAWDEIERGGKWVMAEAKCMIYCIVIKNKKIGIGVACD